jgi:hypothetical protein
MPILGVVASSIQTVSATSYESIATWTSTSPAVSFTSIPSTYKHLQIRWFARTNRPDPNGYLTYRLNSDASANYSQNLIQEDSGVLQGQGATVTGTSWGLNSMGGTGAGSSWGIGIIDIYNYANTNMYKTQKQWSGNARGTNITNNGDIGQGIGSWASLNVVNRIDFIAGYQVTALESGSFFALYGIKG